MAWLESVITGSRAPALRLALLLCLFGLAFVTPVHAGEAAGFRVVAVDTHLEDAVYRLDALFEVRFSHELDEALRNGVPLTFVIEMEISRHRSYLWDEDVALITQRYEARFNALTKHYELYNLNTGVRFNLPDLEVLGFVLGNFVDFPLLDESLIEKDERYQGRIRIRLDVEALPAPLRLTAYTSSGWRLDSEWFSWPLKP